jgi:hypothetical protein
MNQYIKINEYGTKHYYSDAAMTIIHRLDGAAIEFTNGSKEWYVEGKRHRLDGPAMYVGYVGGYTAWYVHGTRLSQEEFIRLTAKEIVLTMDQIAAKFGVDVNNLKITK